MTTRETVQWVLTAVQFVTVIMAGVFILETASIWLRNKREERAANAREDTKWIRTLYDKERESWISILAEKDRELDGLTQAVKRLEKNLDIATRVLQVADKKGEEEC